MHRSEPYQGRRNYPTRAQLQTQLQAQQALRAKHQREIREQAQRECHAAMIVLACEKAIALNVRRSRPASAPPAEKPEEIKWEVDSPRTYTIKEGFGWEEPPPQASELPALELPALELPALPAPKYEYDQAYANKTYDDPVKLFFGNPSAWVHMHPDVCAASSAKAEAVKSFFGNPSAWIKMHSPNEPAATPPEADDGDDSSVAPYSTLSSDEDSDVIEL